MKDHSITSSEALLESKAESLGKTLADFAAPETIVIAIRSEVNTLAQKTGASLVNWLFSPLHVGRVRNKEIGLVPLAVGAPATAMLVEHLISCGSKTFLLSMHACNSASKLGEKFRMHNQ